MILNFLQTRNPPILPSLHKKPHLRTSSIDRRIASFQDDLTHLRGYGQSNKESLAELFFNFFRRYAHDMEYEKYVVSVREGRLISKEAKKWHLLQNNRLCVEEPFNTDRNLGNTTDDISFRGIHLELRRAFDLISDGRLDECLEQYGFPAVEEKVWEKPQAKPAPVLRSRSQSQSSRSSRGGYGGNGGRGTRNIHYKSNGRRASSAAAGNKLALPVQDLHGLRGRDLMTRDQQSLLAQERAWALHQHFMLEMQHLHEQEQRLRIIQAQTQQAHLRESADRNSSLQQFNVREPSHRTVATNHVPMSAPLRQGHFYPPWMYPQVAGTPAQSIHTQPSSPSLNAAQPDLRRTLHRSPGVESGTPSARSHSQPARPSLGPANGQGVPHLPLNNQSYLQYQQQFRSQPQQVYASSDANHLRFSRPDGMMYHDANGMPIDLAFDDNVPKEYIGYWVGDPSLQQNRSESSRHLPPPSELHARVRGVPPSIDRLKKNSRSPSPSISLRDRSYSIRSASSAPTGPLRNDHPHLQHHGNRGGPVIVDGTDGWSSNDYPQPEYTPMFGSSSQTTISEATSGSEEHPDETPATADIDSPFAQIRSGEAFGSEMPPPHSAYTHPFTNGPHKYVSSWQNGIDSTEQYVRSQKPEVLNAVPQLNRSNRTHKTAGGLGIQFGEADMYRASSKLDSNPACEQLNPTTQPVEAESGATKMSSGQFDQPPAPVPLLSPVREVRTPSPVGEKKAEGQSATNGPFPRFDAKTDLIIPTFAELLRAKQAKQQRQSSSLQGISSTVTPSASEVPHVDSRSPPSKHNTAHASQLPSLSGVPSGGQASGVRNKPSAMQANGWQQQSSKKSKKNRRTDSEQSTAGEPLPANASERKGG